MKNIIFRDGKECGCTKYEWCNNEKFWTNNYGYSSLAEKKQSFLDLILDTTTYNFKEKSYIIKDAYCVLQPRCS